MKKCDILDIFAQNMDRGYTLDRVPTLYVLEQKKKTNKKLGLPVKTPVLLYKMGYEGSTLHGHVSMMHSVIIDGMQAKWGTLLCDIARVY